MLSVRARAKRHSAPPSGSGFHLGALGVVVTVFTFREAANFAWIDSEATVACAMTSKAEEYKTQGNELFQKVCDHSSNTN